MSEDLNKSNKNSFDICDYLNDYYTRLNESENNVIKKYLEEEDRCEQIHGKMRKCLGTLDKFETLLTGLKDNLSELGLSASTIGIKTENINQSLEERLQMRAQLRQYVDDVMVSPALIEAITAGTPNDQTFIEQLHDLMHRIQTIHTYDYLESGPVDDARKVIANITDIATKKIKGYLLQRIEHCRKQTTNYTIIQSSLLTYNFLYYFLQSSDPAAANDVFKSYMDIMQNLYYTLMKSYISSLTRLLDSSTIPSINQLLGSTNITNKFNIFSKTNSSFKVDIGEKMYSVVGRERVLKEDLFNDSLIPHLIATKQKLHMETIFRSLLYAILSNCFNELDFMNDFFKLNNENLAENYFDTIFGRSFQYFLSSMDKFLAQHLDFVGLILSIGVTSRYFVVASSKNIKVCNKYLASILDLLWFRFGEVINFNLANLSNVENDNFQIANLLPNNTTCRCANAISTLLAVKGDSSFRKIEDNISSIFKEWRSHIEKMSNEFQIKADRLIFLGNNLYYMVESIQNTQPIGFPEGFSAKIVKSQECTSKQLIMDEITTDIDIILNEIIEIDIDRQFSYCIEVIRKHKKGNDSPGSKTLKVTTVVNDFISEFSSNWKNTLKNTVNRYKVLFFSLNLNSKLIQRYLNRFVQSYNIVIDFVSTSNVVSNVQLVDLQVIMVEIKKYTDLIT